MPDFNVYAAPGSGAIDFGTHRYKAQLAKVSPAQFDISQHRKCMLGISLGTHNIEGARLEAVLEWISANCHHCAVVVGDSVYRLTLQLQGVSADDALAQALADGRAFEATYAPLFRQYAAKCRFEWLPLSEVASHANFPQHMRTLEALYASDRNFQQSVQGFARAYLHRGEEREVSPEALATTRTYLIEESALFACLREQDWPVLVYPGSIDSIVDLCEGKFPGAPEPLSRLAFVALEVKRKGLFFADGASKVIRAGATQALQRVGLDHEFLRDLEDVDWAKLLKATRLRKFAPREVVVEAGSNERHLLILIDGRAEVLAHRSDGSKQQLAVLEQGTVFGEQSFLDGLPRSATVTAMEECQVRTLSLKDFNAWAQQEPRIALAVLADLGKILSLRARHMLFEMQHMP